jgi:hypothetical protein
MLVLVLSAALALGGGPKDARLLAHQALDAIGGEAALSQLHAVRLTGLRRRVALEQSTRPTGPWLEDIEDVVETRWPEDGALHDQGHVRGLSTLPRYDGKGGVIDLTVVGDRAVRRSADHAVPAGGSALQTAQETLALGPERALFTALAAADLHLEAPAMLNGYTHEVLGFTWSHHPVRVYIDPVSKTPAAVEIVRPRPTSVYWDPWGDIDTRVDWDVWMLEPGGVRYPRLWATTSNGQPEAMFLIDRIDLNPQDAATPQPPAPQPTPRLVAQLPFPSAEAVRLVAPGIRQVPGSWNILEIDVDGATFVVEGPMSNAYSAAEQSRLNRLGRPIAGLITTSDSWPHIGGLRDYVAHGVPIYALDLNAPILKRLLAAPHRTNPDALEQAPRAPDLHLIGSRTTLGGRGRRIELIPLRTANGERQMAVWIPAEKLLYTSDLFTVLPDGSVFLPGAVQEMRDVVNREHLDVETVVGMHYGPTSWAAVLRGAKLV